MAQSWSKKRKILIGVAGVVLLGAMVAVNLTRGKATSSASKSDEMVVVKRGRVAEQLKETGRIEFVRTVEVKSTVSGEIVHLGAEPGDEVVSGQVLAVIEPDPNQTLQLYNKRAAVERAQIDLDRIRKELARKESLKAHNLVAEEEIERIRDQFQKAHNAYRLAQLELETLETRSNIRRSTEAQTTDQKLDDVRVLAPASGIVIKRPVEIGEVVVSGIASTVMGTVMFEIGDPSEMMVKARISEVDVGRLRPGQEVHIIVDAYPDTTYLGEVHRIAPVGQIPQGSSIVSFETEIRMLNPEPRLRQGMSCDIDILFSERDSTAYLPIEALYEDFGEDARMGDKKGIRGRFLAYRKIEGDFVETEVEVGLKSDTRIEILANLAPGDTVAVNAEKVFEKRKKKKDREQDGEKDEKSDDK